MEKIEDAIAALGKAAEDFLSKDSFTRSDAPLITIAEQMLQMQKGWQIQINAAKQKAVAATVTAPVMPGYVADDA